MEKLNIAELLKDYPSGMELDCTMYEDVYFDYVDELNIIHCYIQRKSSKTNITFNQYGTPNSDVKSKCVIFPKGKTTWEGFPRSFKDGDIIYNPNINAVSIFNKQTDDKTISHCFLNINNELRICHYHSKFLDDWRLATEEEKQKLFDFIKSNGYCWNAETKTLEKLIEPKFKVGDKIKHCSIETNNIYTIVSIEGLKYLIQDNEEHVYEIKIKSQDDWKLVPKKFDINTLKPFDKVLVRDNFSEPWNINYFSYINSDKMFKTIMGTYLQCVPYEGNEYLLGSFVDCKDYYKTWE